MTISRPFIIIKCFETDPKRFARHANKLGSLIAQNNWTLLYGGGSSGKCFFAQSENRTPVPTLEGLDDNHYTNCAFRELFVQIF